MGWLVCACITIFHEVITVFFFFFFFGNSLLAKYILADVSWCRVHTNAFELQYLKEKKKEEKHCYQYKDFNHRCKGYTLGKTPVSLPITTGYSLPPTWDRFRQKKKRQSNYKWGMTGQNCTSLHWIPYILDRRPLTLAHQATFQIGRQFRFPWQPAENGWLEIGLYVPPQFRFYAFVKARPPVRTDVVVAACLRGVFFVSSLIAACSTGPFSLRKQFFYASRGFCPYGGKQRCGCSQMRQAGTSCTFDGFRYDGGRGELVSSCWKRGRRMTVDICWERKTSLGGGGGGGGNDHTSAVNEDLDVSTHSERSPSHSLRRGIVGTNVRASLRVSCQEKSQAGALCQNVGKITIIHLNDPRSKKKKIVTFPIVASCASRGRRACKNFEERRRSGPGTQKKTVTAPGAFAFKPRENLNFGAIICLALLFDHVVSRQECERQGIPTRVRKTTVRTTPVRSQQCECQQCERVNSANANSANATAVRMSAVRMRQQCERRFSELCKTYWSLSFFFCKNFCYFLPQFLT